MLDKVLAEANISKSDLDAIAYTSGPGLMGALMVGGSVATAMAYSLEIPVLGVHHMEGHLLAPMLEENPPEYPFLPCWFQGGIPSWFQLLAWASTSWANH